MSEELVNRVTQESSLVGQTRLAIDVNHQSKRCVAGQVLGSTHYELFGFRIQIPITKRRGIDGVEQLLQFAYVHLDHGALWRNGVASTRFILGSASVLPLHSLAFA
jgi:hypothetical protein